MGYKSAFQTRKRMFISISMTFLMSSTYIPVFSAKAVADGAISYYLDGHVSSRVARVTYGAPAGVPYNAFDPEHLRRTDFHRHLPSGRVVVNGGFEVVLLRGTIVDEEKEFRRPFFDETTSWETLNNLTLDVIAYTGNGGPPKWIDETDPSAFDSMDAVDYILTVYDRKISSRRSSKFKRIPQRYSIFFSTNVPRMAQCTGGMTLLLLSSSGHQS